MAHTDIGGNLFRCQRRRMRIVDRQGFDPVHRVGKSCHSFRIILWQALLGGDHAGEKSITHIQSVAIGNDPGLPDAGDRRKILK